jgi:hypothetical protein
VLAAAAVAILAIVAAVAWRRGAIDRSHTNAPANAAAATTARTERGAPAPASTSADQSASGTPQEGQPLELTRSPRAETFATALRNGSLPPAAPLPRGRIEQQADALASAVFAGTDGSLAAWHQAVLASGYGVRRADGTVERTVTPGQGLVLDEWEVAGFAKMYGEGRGVTLKHLADSLRQIPAWKDVPIEQGIVTGVHDAVFSARPELQFWGRFIIELGRRSSAPYDLLGTIDPAKTRLDAIQFYLILTRLAGEYTTTMPRPQAFVPIRPDVALARWSPAAFQPTAPCSAPSGIEGFVLDQTAMLTSMIFGNLITALGGKQGPLGEALGTLNVLLTLVKFAAVYSLVEQHVLSPNGPLVRTKTTTMGGTIILTDRVTMPPSYFQYVNCARSFLNKAGIDVTMPEAGPIEGVSVDWRIERGADDLIFFAVTNSAAVKSVTGTGGVTGAMVTGRPQEKDLSQRKIVEMRKEATVRTSAAVKPTRVGNAQEALNALSDSISSLIGYFTGDALGATYNTAAEVGYRQTWAETDPYTLTVIDWEPCGNVWSGNIEYTEIFGKLRTDERPGLVKHEMAETRSYTASTRIFQSRPDGKPSGMSRASATMLRTNKSTGLTECHADAVELDVASGGGGGDAYISVSIGPNGDYDVGYTLPIVDSEGKSTMNYQKSGSCRNPFNASKNDSRTYTGQLGPEGNLEIKGHVDPNKPDSLSGTLAETKEVRGGVRTSTVSWALARCQ